MQADALFLFDIDGTLMRGGNAVHRDAFAHAFETVYGRSLSLDGVPAGGRTDTWLVMEPLRRARVPDSEIRARLADAFAAMNRYVEERLGPLDEFVLPGVREVLGALHRDGHLLGLLTGNLSRIAMLKLQAAGLARYFDTGGFGEESEVRSHLVPVAVAHAASAAGRVLPLDRVLVTGDTPLDVEAGQAHGTRTVAVATGTFTQEELAASGADLVLPSFEDAERAVSAMLALLPQDHSPQA